MNIESILEKIRLFEKLVIDSGFKRDITDYSQAIRHGQNRTLVFMKNLSNKIIEHLTLIEENLLAHELEIILKKSKPFTDLNSLSLLKTLNENSTIDANAYFQNFSSILNILAQAIEQNDAELREVKKIFSLYSSNVKTQGEESKALISLIFNDIESTRSLKGISKALNRWSRTLLIYHTLLTSKSPEEISLIGIQDGCIDTIINVDINIAIDLTEIITTALKVYGAYLIYKTETAQEIIKSYAGNKKLIKMEKYREKLMLDNINIAVENKIQEQHKEALKKDKNIDKTAVKKKVQEVSKVVVDHIIKGNEVKLLTSFDDEEAEEEENNQVKINELNETTLLVRSRSEKLEEDEKQKLLELYSVKDDENC